VAAGEEMTETNVCFTPESSHETEWSFTAIYRQSQKSVLSPSRSATKWQQRLPFKDKTYMQRLIEGWRKAGLAEN